MGIKVIVFGLLCGTVVQAFPQYVLGNNGANQQFEFHPLISDDKQKSCNEKLDWYKNTTEKVKGYYDLYYARFQQLKLNTDKVRDIEAQHKEFEDLIHKSLDQYKEDKKKFFNISENSLTVVFCKEEINWFKALDQHLVGIAQDVRSDVSNFMDALGVPKETRDSVDAALARVVNFLFIIDLTKNTFKDIGSLIIELNKKTAKTVDGLKPENANKDKPEDVEYAEDALDSNGELEKEEGLSHVVSDLQNKTEIEEAEFREKERVKQQEKAKTEIEEREPYEPIYEIQLPKA